MITKKILKLKKKMGNHQSSKHATMFHGTKHKCIYCGQEHSLGDMHQGCVRPRDVVVIPVDAGRASLRAFNWYIENIHHPENRVHVVHCCEPEHPSGKHYPDYAVPPEQWEDKLSNCKALGNQILRPYEKAMKDHEIEGSISTKLGRPGKAIIDTATECNASMIVMGSRGLGPIARKLLGSVSGYVVTKSEIPVTIVPPPQKLELLWYILH